MKTLIISYSFSGNNALLAKNLAEKARADYTEIRELRKRNIFSIVLDIVLNRTPKIQPLQTSFENYDHIIFVAPIWFGKIASPFRQVFRQCRDQLIRYSFISISGGANGIRPRVEKELKYQLGKSPFSLFHSLISDLLPESQRGNQKILNAYRLSWDEASYISELALQNM
jgi:multimeric flavodoxin WrbA